ncbi:MAG: undecaprenyl-diphosphate phosphatase [Prevotellaceae bacterium]|jgi:undecaprenyl-diphosphatase|nr:undecaprenyl-diphosphate phosphatase [Prevotellaceae bacterium]
MTIIQTIIIAIVEGLTEFLPVSSTGHMILAQALLGIESTDFVKMFTVNIQFGAILSVIVLYFKRFVSVNPIKIFEKFEKENRNENLTFLGKINFSGKHFFRKISFYLKRFLEKFNFYKILFIAFVPAAVLGFIFSDYIDKLLESVHVVAVMLIVGGVFMLFVDKWFNAPSSNQEIDWLRALKIGFCQCIAMIPGVSRSMATIAGGMGSKLTRKNAAEFSFFLAVPTMAAASGYSLLKLLKTAEGAKLFTDNWMELLLGNAVAFAVAMLAIKFFIDFITKFGFKFFGWYRIVVGLIIISLLLANVNLSVI